RSQREHGAGERIRDQTTAPLQIMLLDRRPCNAFVGVIEVVRDHGGEPINGPRSHQGQHRKSNKGPGTKTVAEQGLAESGFSKRESWAHRDEAACLWPGPRRRYYTSLAVLGVQAQVILIIYWAGSEELSHMPVETQRLTALLIVIL